MTQVRTTLGKVGLTPKGDYDVETEYTRLDLISSSGSSFVVLKDGVIGVTPTPDNANYMLLAERGEKLKFSDLTAEERDVLKLHLSDLSEEEIVLLQEPAKEAVALANAAAESANAATGKANDAAGLANTNAGKADVAALRATDAAKAAESIVSDIRPDYNEDDKTKSTFIANRPEIPTLPAVPTTTTLNYVNSYGNTIAFRIGNEVRVLEGDSYAYYKLSHLENNKAFWTLESGERVVKVNDLLDIEAGKTYAFLAAADNSVTGTMIETADHVDLLESLYMYGVEWIKGQVDPTCTRIGNMNLHRTLPIHNKMRRCLLNAAGAVNYYLDANDSSKKESIEQDGQEDAVLDGTDGNVMVEIPKLYNKFEKDGDVRRYKLSEKAIPGYTLIKKRYISAFLMQRNRKTIKAASIINTSADYRGGLDYPTAEMISWDDTVKSLLGKATISRADTLPSYSANLGGNWRMGSWSTFNELHWLCVVEFGTHCYKLPFDSSTDNGLKQGGISSGVVGCNFNALQSYNLGQPFLNNGVTLSLGNNSGIVKIPVAIPNLITLDIVEANSYRGIEHPYSYWYTAIGNFMISVKTGIANPVKYILGGRKDVDGIDNFEYALTVNDNGLNLNCTPIDFYQDFAFIPVEYVAASGKSYTCAIQRINKGYSEFTFLHPMTFSNYSTAEGLESFVSVKADSDSQINQWAYATSRIEYII